MKKMRSAWQKHCLVFLSMILNFVKLFFLRLSFEIGFEMGNKVIGTTLLTWISKWCNFMRDIEKLSQQGKDDIGLLDWAKKDKQQ